MLCSNWLVYIISTMWQINKFRSSLSLPFQMYATVELQSYIYGIHEVIGMQITTKFNLSLRTHVFRLLLQPYINDSPDRERLSVVHKNTSVCHKTCFRVQRVRS